MRAVVVGVAGLAVLLVPGCGQGPGSSSPAGGGSAVGAGTTVECGGSVYDADAVADAPPVSSLADGPAGAVDDLGEPAVDPSLGWSVVHQDDDRVDLVRELGEPVDDGDGDVRTHESVTLERITGSSNVADGTWLRTSSGPCAQRLLQTDGLDAADITLAGEPDPGAQSLALLVRERECASGQDPTDRIRVDVAETADQVVLRVGVRPLRGGQDCRGNPAAAVGVDLAGPLGDREVVDGSVVPARPVPVSN